MDDDILSPKPSAKSHDGLTIDQYLEKARTLQQVDVTSRPGAAPSGKNEPSELENEVRMFLSALNRDERRAWLAKQSRVVGKQRKGLFTK